MKKIAQRLSVIGATFALMIGAVFVSPAFAAYENCTVGLCTYTNVNGGGTLYYYTGAGFCVNIGGGLNDTMSSVKNNWPSSNATAVLYREANCYIPGGVLVGWRQPVAPQGGKINDLHAYGIGDAVSSLWIGPGAP